jgi:hypothetical protein
MEFAIRIRRAWDVTFCGVYIEPMWCRIMELILIAYVMNSKYLVAIFAGNHMFVR